MWFWPEKLRFEPWMIFAPQIVVAGIMHIVRDQRAQKGGVA
jgi:hypothetical protein